MKIEKTTLKDIDNLIKISKTESIPKKPNKWNVDNQRLHECFVKYNTLKTEALEKGEDPRIFAFLLPGAGRPQADFCDIIVAIADREPPCRHRSACR